MRQLILWWLIWLAGAGAALAQELPVSLCGASPCEVQVEGIVWQPDVANAQPNGAWHRLGVRTLLVQWLVVDDVAFVQAAGLGSASVATDWLQIGKSPWAQDVIVGLAGRFSETAARTHLNELQQKSLELARLSLPVNGVGWYFPVEVDPTWTDASALKDVLLQLPRPLWISAYDSANLGADELVKWFQRWLPADVGVFFQDGVGVHARDAVTARTYVDVLSQHLGRDRLRVIAEAFRPRVGGGFRSASAEELCTQLRAYAGHQVYLFDGPHYVPPSLVDELLSGSPAKSGSE